MEPFPRVERIARSVETGPEYNCVGRRRSEINRSVFVHALHGEGRFSDASGEHRVGPGEGFLCNVADPEIRYFYPPSGREPWDFLWISVSGCQVIEQTRELVSRHGGVYALGREHAFERRLAEYERYSGSIRELTPCTGARIAAELFEALESAAAPRPGSDTRNVLTRWAMEIMRRNLRGTLAVSDVARNLNVSREHLSRVFCETTGMRVGDYLRRERVREACRMLRESTLSVKEISRELGFSAQTNFSRAFREVIGSTPVEYRRGAGLPLV